MQTPTALVVVRTCDPSSCPRVRCVENVPVASFLLLIRFSKNVGAFMREMLWNASPMSPLDG